MLYRDSKYHAKLARKVMHHLLLLQRTMAMAAAAACASSALDAMACADFELAAV